MSYDNPTSPSAAYGGKFADPKMSRKGNVPGTLAPERANNDAAGRAYQKRNLAKEMSNSYAVGEAAARRTISETYVSDGLDGNSSFGKRATKVVTERPVRGVPSR